MTILKGRRANTLRGDQKGEGLGKNNQVPNGVIGSDLIHYQKQVSRTVVVKASCSARRGRLSLFMVRYPN